MKKRKGSRMNDPPLYEPMFLTSVLKKKCRGKNEYDYETFLRLPRKTVIRF